MTAPSRAPTTLAVGVLVLDAVLCLYLGAVTRRAWPALLGAGCAVAAVVVVAAWRRYRRTLADLDRARREMKAEAESLRELLRAHPPQR